MDYLLEALRSSDVFSSAMTSILKLKRLSVVVFRAVLDPLLLSRFREFEPRLFFGETDICMLLLLELFFVGEAGSFSMDVIMCIGFLCFFSHSFMFEDRSLFGVRKD